ncbi:MAG: sigma-54 dependent transcriptional regulator [Pseudomonadota bacterium]
MSDIATPVMIVDDEADMRDSIAQWMELRGFTPMPFDTAETALSALDDDFAGLIITDVRMPGINGLEFLDRLQKIDRELPVVLITGHGDVAMAVEAMRAGAYDFVEKPFDPERLADLAQRAAQTRRLVIDNRLLRKGLSDGSSLMRRIVGTSPPIEALRRDIEAYATSPATLTIRGERGTGRSLVARTLHACGPRPEQPFVEINCAAEQPERLEVQLFRADRFGNPPVLAGGGGTVCLEGVGALPVRLQTLLFETISRKTLPDGTGLTVRVIAIEGDGDEDAPIEALSEVLNALQIQVPPLRDCGGDILTLFDRHTDAFAHEYECPRPVVSAEDAAALMTHSWPGNLRQLTNTAERFVLRNRQESASVADVLDAVEDASAVSETPAGLRQQVDAFEKLMIEEALRRHKGSITAAIEDLDIPRRTLNEKMAKHGISRADYV